MNPGLVKIGDDFVSAVSGLLNPRANAYEQDLLKRFPGSEWQYQCTSCGEQIDEDHDYCSPCDQRGGENVLVDEHGEQIDTANYGVNTFHELVAACEVYFEHLEKVLERPAMQKVIDEHGNEACRIVRGGTRAAGQTLKDVLRRAKS